MKKVIINIVSSSLVALITYYGTNLIGESNTNKIIDTYSMIIQQQSQALVNCK